VTTALRSETGFGRVRIVGSGMIGASVGFALRGVGVEVLLADREPGRVSLASDLGAGSPDDDGDADLCVVAVPPSETGTVIAERLRLGLDRTVTDCASVKLQPLREVETFSTGTSRYAGGHPIAGRERGGPAAGRADLFVGHPWVVAPHFGSTQAAISAVTDLARHCGAVPVTMTPEQHDRTLAVLSHLPQLAASALAAEAGTLPGDALSLAGQGLIDMTRIADSPEALWAEIGAANAGPIADSLDRLASRLTTVAADLRDDESSPAAQRSVVAALLRAGGDGRRRLPGKHGGPRPDFVGVAVGVPDAPGELARLFADVGAAAVNIEDFAVEHEPGRSLGIVTLSVRPEAVVPLRNALERDNWSIYP
jgi:prephenate dehydrogenase